MPRRRTPAKGEIWHVNGDPVEGHEFKGAHYYLVLSERELVAAMGTAMCVPVTSGGAMARSKSTTVYIDGNSTDTGKITGVALCHQIRALDLVTRKGSYSCKAESQLVDEIIMMVVDLLDPR
ncbi:type II toxin-antitoxin system PemK/MazF family toxin [Salmonella enterica subsp. enterica]|uniref:type II toxin-antitoxin system PemK/MazF family toxin n=1 Tax=Salmonella enterica TaxID=28901 RepID=UPI0012C9B526|nr:type II toxin-antitoxin system PemK/MazF family toxin [Salmonella enterica]EDU8906374.1 type II toxin-antitoxin system PemK/MazF family toxin [Salmonella enterica subsp. enterica]EDV0415270.1 type II toxin-antitoxin system PemK/MazF family toxin [Salmonella enterica subsp. enterica serovar Glostrup]EED3638270.1 type II toxin-antitoxin system PemK/MazF family toxin [Salmonella enterica subsp. enterica serovar Sundsvall]EAP3911080.1 type II toxin-antitoxin system PemK/MazF family toxin [Salmon